MKNRKGLGNRPTLIFELVNIFGKDSLEYKVEFPSDVVKEIFRHLCGMDKTEDDTLCQLREMLDIISVSPQSVLLDGQEEIELIRFATKKYVRDLTSPYVLDIPSADREFVLNTRKIEHDKHKINNLKEQAHILEQLLPFWDIADTHEYHVLIYPKEVEKLLD